LRLALWRCPAGVDAPAGNRIVYDLERDQAHAAPSRVDGHALLWALSDDEAEGALLASEVELGDPTRWLMRCDRVDFAPGGVAHRHTHPGPGIRCLLRGEITVETEGHTGTYGPLDAWFERGPDPVHASTSPSEESAFVRVMLVPAEYAGRRTIRYVDPADADKPKLQRATILLEQPLRP
jgi:quercetin dioxygenase-like cupin family protein